MQKKLMALAVAGALAAPGVALAQTSTVQIYGYLNAEYGFVDQPDVAVGVGQRSTDAFNSGASRIGFRGEEKLSGGMSAWFQCETQVNGVWSLGTAQSGWCNRNTAIGLKGGFGNVYFGRWDSAMKKASGVTRILNEAGWMGAQHMLIQEDFFTGWDFSTRNTHSVNYDTPNFGGFTASFQYTAAHGAIDSADVAGTSNNNKGRIWSANGIYRGGPLALVAAYERHTDNVNELSAGIGVTPAACGALGVGCVAAADGDSRAWLLGASYQFGPVKVGVVWADLRGDVSALTVLGAGGTTVPLGDVKRRSLNLAADWKITGPGTVRVGLTRAYDLKGSIVDALAAAGVNTDTGGTQYQIGYLHSLSKRTTLGVTYAHIDNDGGAFYNFTNLTTPANPGDDAGVLVLQMIHTF
jgi:predicted porin